MGVVPGRDQDELRRERLRERDGHAIHERAEHRRPDPGRPGKLTVNPRPGPGPDVCRGTRPRVQRRLMDRHEQDPIGSWKMSLVPLPWCTSQSTIITRSSPRASSACRAATAMLLNRQKPIARAVRA